MRPGDWNLLAAGVFTAMFLVHLGAAFIVGFSLWIVFNLVLQAVLIGWNLHDYRRAIR